MSDASLNPAYRQRVYDTYVSQGIKLQGACYSEEEYRRWANAALFRLRGWLPPDRNEAILDMGCGPGNFLYLLARLGYTNLTGVDLSPEQVALARQWCPQATIVHGDARKVLAENVGRFGLVAGFDVIEHFRKEELLELSVLVAQALRPGGRVILQTLNAESPWGLMHRYGDLTHEVGFTTSSLAHLLRLAGLSALEARECGPYPHGVKSCVRAFLWSLIRAGLMVWNLAETGSSGSRVYTRILVGSAVKDVAP